MDNEKDYESLINQKCSACFRKREYLLLVSERGECLCPFTEVQEQINKFRKYCEENLSKPKADLDKAIREVLLKNYLRKKKLFDDSEDR